LRRAQCYSPARLHKLQKPPFARSEVSTHDGGIIAIKPDGQVAWSFNSSGMYRARLAENGKAQISIYKDEP